MRFALILSVILAVLAVMFALQNPNPMEVEIAGWIFTGSTALVLMVTFGIGVLVGILATMPGLIRRGRRVKTLERDHSTATTLGKPYGTEHDFDANAILLRLVTLGIYQRPWQDARPYPEWPPSIGYYSVEGYDPADWRSNIVNPAFINRTARDGYWGAKLVMSFTDAQLEAAVRAGEYSDPAAAAYLLEGLKARRDATARYWFREVSPLHRPRVEAAEALLGEQVDDPARDRVGDADRRDHQRHRRRHLAHYRSFSGCRRGDTGWRRRW